MKNTNETNKETKKTKGEISMKRLTSIIENAIKLEAASNNMGKIPCYMPLYKDRFGTCYNPDITYEPKRRYKTRKVFTCFLDPFELMAKSTEKDIMVVKVILDDPVDMPGCTCDVSIIHGRTVYVTDKVLSTEEIIKTHETYVKCLDKIMDEYGSPLTRHLGPGFTLDNIIKGDLETTVATKDKSAIISGNRSIISVANNCVVLSGHASQITAREQSVIDAGSKSVVSVKRDCAISVGDNSTITTRGSCVISAGDDCLISTDHSTIECGKNCMVVNQSSMGRFKGGINSTYTINWGGRPLTAHIDGVTLKPDTWYTVNDREFVEIPDRYNGMYR